MHICLHLHEASLERCSGDKRKWLRGGGGAGKRVGSAQVEEGVGKEGDTHYVSVFARRFSNYVNVTLVYKCKGGSLGGSVVEHLPRA